jgi:hypothetical protein
MFKALNRLLIDHLIPINNKRFFIFIFHLMGSISHFPLIFYQFPSNKAYYKTS